MTDPTTPVDRQFKYTGESPVIMKRDADAVPFIDTDPDAPVGCANVPTSNHVVASAFAAPARTSTPANTAANEARFVRFSMFPP